MRDPALELVGRRLRHLDRRATLRPLAANELLDASARVFRLQGVRLLKLTAVPVLFCDLVIVFFFTFLWPYAQTTSNPESAVVQATEVGGVVVLGVLVAAPLLLMALSYTTSLTCRLTADLIMGNEPDEDTARQVARKTLFGSTWLNFRIFLAASLPLVLGIGLIVTSSLLSEGSEALQALLAAVAVFGIFAAFITVPWVLTKQALVPPVAAIEGIPPKRAFARAKALMQRTTVHPAGTDVFVQLWGLLFLFGTIAGFGSLIVFSILDAILASGGLDLGSGVFERAIETLVQLVPWFVVLWVTVPLWSVVSTLVYFDRRVRLEGFDIQMLQADARRASRAGRFQI